MSELQQPRALYPTGLIEFDGQPAVHLRAPGGAQATVLLHGGHVVSWIPAGGEEQLYLSPATAYGEGSAVRGGVPVIFPQFNNRGPLPKHGFARNRGWTLQQATVRGEHAFAVLRLVDDEASRALWPHPFELELTVSVDAGRLEMEMAVVNTGDTVMSFQAALHTYLATADVRRAQLEGLLDQNYHDAVLDQPRQQWIDVVSITQELDRIYWNAPPALTLREAGRRLSIRSSQFEDVVVWNPGPEKCAQLKDMPADGWLGMLCVEAAQIGVPVVLAPGQEWTGMQTLIAEN
ncbi:glucose-6-phosphate 1-epimerase [Sphaerotilus hippei]|uniref:Putative glucose-6-phosphate 1-epimerase n=1 Tax=Sphaerotilus hippei TaxID=744406 RepID=A0A318GW63_9BURK|nr:D-hexose-6-phosphate mutarotase [Sphaerotilus hippei]PXW93861.1 glucose-6-phosphate 1-epimerase [Sphaerotilus hippei]